MTDISAMTVPKWMAIKKNLEAIQAIEMKARLELVKRSGHVAIGSKTVAMDGYKISVTNPENSTIFEPSLADVREKLGEEKFASAFKTKFSVSATGLKALTKEEREVANEAITTSAGTPAVKVTKVPEEGSTD